MLTAITVGYPHGQGAKPKVLVGPDVPYPKQLEDFKKLCASKVNKDFAAVELWTSGSGASKRIKFISPDEAKRREKAAEAEAKEIEAAKKKTEAEAKS